ncbi:CarD family transcriptional regulator [Clostridium aminobutyricum]|uniref:CarD family transcriptional regulator n=1 Tax=Clostridium aminobutyricum TaxID=33953 RepID=A0A939DB00_CLOAM|nr:CarD family transcriptional regulator [Clostridium aminobutyricum]MBN7774420.1 CarD family transcriptional regulator [Clostridium aminobutyricum]
MFIIGDKIVYPMHGAGIVEGIEEKKILGETRRYYILKVPCGDMKIMIPVDTSDDIGVRRIISEAALIDVMSTLEDVTSEMSANWNRRYRENMEKLKTGNAVEVAEVVRNLVRMDREKKLSTGEKKMLSNAKQILLSEIILVRGMGQIEANDMVDQAI